ncbi:MAG: ferrous iron transporter B, partial [Kiritimatiellaceae bacterium]|nr:ferrous iron transporter B [Kiritimatiellaceae bacterium]
MSKITIALAGNPNCGKTTLFNALTGSSQRVGNWPGVTVGGLEGKCQWEDADVEVVDLPGIYSFSAYSVDEKVSREYILKDKPDVVVNIVDATNVERNLYLTTQLLEMRVPIVVVLNMMDLARQNKIKINVESLEKHLGCPVIPLVASRREGFDELKKAVLAIAASRAVSSVKVEYNSDVEAALSSLSKEVEGIAAEAKVDRRWLAIKLMEGDALAEEITHGAQAEQIKKIAVQIRHHGGDDLDVVIADCRYGFIHGLAKEVVTRSSQLRRTISNSIDNVVLNRVLGIPIFMLVMYSVFFLTTNVGGGFIDFFDILCGTLFVDGFGVLL